MVVRQFQPNGGDSHFGQPDHLCRRIGRFHADAAPGFGRADRGGHAARPGRQDFHLDELRRIAAWRRTAPQSTVCARPSKTPHAKFNRREKENPETDWRRAVNANRWFSLACETPLPEPASEKYKQIANPAVRFETDVRCLSMRYSRVLGGKI
jgi:hypothetical protein